jgi:hypothetical protein
MGGGNTNEMRLVNEKNILDKLASLKILETLINLVNKRVNTQNEFKKLDGYVLLQRIYSSIAGFNKFLVENRANSQSIISYYSIIQKKLFVILANGCFRKPAFSMNYYLDDEINIELCFNPPKLKNKPKDESACMHLVNLDLLTHVILEWELWIPLDFIIKNATSSPAANGGGGAGVYLNTNGQNLWKYLFQIMHKLLDEDSSSQLYHTSLFLNQNWHEKLVYFLLDINAEHFIVDETSCSWFIRILNYFSGLFKSEAFTRHKLINSNGVSITKQLFFHFGDYLYILHPDNNVYIVNQKSEFYFNLNLSEFF